MKTFQLVIKTSIKEKVVLTFTFLSTGIKDLNIASKYPHLAAKIVLCAGISCPSKFKSISQNSFPVTLKNIVISCSNEQPAVSK